MIASERGFTLVEILVSLAIFAIVVIGALGIMGAAGGGGFLEGFPVGFATTRAARDTTAAAVYLQALQEYAANQGGSTLTVGSYCWGPDNCPAPNLPSAGLGLAPTPPTQPYQLDARTLTVTIEKWYWDDSTGNKRYRCSLPASASCNFAVPVPATESLVHMNSTLRWQYRGLMRTMTVDRFLP
jgi:prepilin-type N-terminal cleavage/methylation domain-containing protein